MEINKKGQGDNFLIFFCMWLTYSKCEAVSVTSEDIDLVAIALSICVSAACVESKTKTMAVVHNGLLSPLFQQHLTLSCRE